MRKILAVLILFNGVNSLAQSWQWAKTATNGYSEGKAVAADFYGNVYVAGNYTSSVYFDGILYPNAGRTDLFLAKYDCNGNLQWVRTAGSSGDDAVYSLAVGRDGNAVITGSSAGDQSQTINFGSHVLNNSQGIMFLVKYDSSGGVIWAEANKGAIGLATDIDPSGAIFVTGTYATVATFEGYTLTPNGWHDIFVVKYDPNGSLMWIRSFGGKFDNLGYAVVAGSHGSVYVAGVYSDTLRFLWDTLTCSNAKYNIFLAKYDADGNVFWGKSAGGIALDVVSSLTIDEKDNPIIAGHFNSDSINFGHVTLTNSEPHYDMYIAKYDSSGNVLWAKKAGGTEDDYATGVTSDSLGNIFLTGYFKSPNLLIGSDSLKNSTCSPGSDMFVAGYNGNGDPLWAMNAGSCEDFSSAIACTKSSQVYITGSFEAQNLNLGSITINNAGAWAQALFVARLDLQTSGMHQVHSEAEFTAYPNPGNTLLTIRYRSHSSTSPRVIIRNSFGQIVFAELISSFGGEYTRQIDVRNFPAGVYSIEVSDGERRTVKSIVIN